MILHGKDLIVSIDGNSMLASKSCTLTVSAKSLAKTSPTSGQWEETMAGKKSWSLSTNHLVKPATEQTTRLEPLYSNFYISNSKESGWVFKASYLGSMTSRHLDEWGMDEGICLLEVSKYATLTKKTLFNKDGYYNSTKIEDYLNGTATIDGSTITETGIVVIMTVGEFVLSTDVCNILTAIYHVALPCIQFGSSPIVGEKTYDTTPIVIVVAKTFGYGYTSLNPDNNDVNFTLYNGVQLPQLDGIPGSIAMIGKEVSIRMTDNDGSTWAGKAIVTQFKVTGSKGSLMTGAFSFKGSGELQLDNIYDIKPMMPSTNVQRIIINMNESEPEKMITGDVDGWIVNSILSNAHRYLSKYIGNGAMAVCQLADDDTDRFYNGDYATIDGTHGDVFMRFKWNFYYRITAAGSKKYVFEISTQNLGGSWKVWNANNLIGAFRGQMTASYDDNVASQDVQTGYLRSIYAERTPYSDTYQNILTLMEGRNADYFGIVGPEEHAMIALLFFMKYGTTNSQAMCGKGAGSGATTYTGASVRLGMNDTNGYTGIDFVNIFGLEDWWSGVDAELMERITYQNGYIRVTPWGGSSASASDVSIAGVSNETVISNMLFSDSPLRMVPEGEQPKKPDDPWSKYFCDAVKIIGRSQVVTRGKGDDGGGRGISALKLGRSTDDADDKDAARLCFRGGMITEYTDTAAFLNVRVEDPGD